MLVGLTGLEPVTPRLSSACSNQLSYRPGFGSLSRNWWRHGDSNPGHPACKAGALPTELYPQLRFLVKKGRHARRARFCSKRTGCLHIFGSLRALAGSAFSPLGKRSDLCTSVHLLHRKEVIQPQVPLRLPCYDFIPVTSLTLGPCLLAVGFRYFGCDRLP